MSESITKATETIARHKQAAAALIAALGRFYKETSVAAEQFRRLGSVLERAIKESERNGCDDS